MVDEREGEALKGLEEESLVNLARGLVILGNHRISFFHMLL